MKRLFFTSCIVFFAFTHSFSQSSTSINSKHFDLIEINSDNWSFYSNDDSQLFYIDFEKLTFNISDIILKDADGNMVFEDDVLDLPVNTIYELDLSKYESGLYEVELRTFTGNLKKEVTIK